MEFSVCGECDRGKNYSRECVYCLLFGIMIHRNHTGCKYHREGDLNEQVQEPEGGDTGRHV